MEQSSGLASHAPCVFRDAITITEKGMATIAVKKRKPNPVRNRINAASRSWRVIAPRGAPCTTTAIGQARDRPGAGQGQAGQRAARDMARKPCSCAHLHGRDPGVAQRGGKPCGTGQSHPAPRHGKDRPPTAPPTPAPVTTALIRPGRNASPVENAISTATASIATTSARKK